MCRGAFALDNNGEIPLRAWTPLNNRPPRAVGARPLGYEGHVRGVEQVTVGLWLHEPAWETGRLSAHQLRR